VLAGFGRGKALLDTGGEQAHIGVERLQRLGKPLDRTLSDGCLFELLKDCCQASGLVDDRHASGTQRRLRIRSEQHRRERGDLRRLARELERLRDRGQAVARHPLEGAIDPSIGHERDGASDQRQAGDAREGEEELGFDAKSGHALAPNPDRSGIRHDRPRTDLG
jgi:hypothetical protein